LAGELIEEYGDDLQSITLARGGSGQFDVNVDGKEIYSKHKVKRHPNPGEVVESLRSMV
jgi:selT/selW/selH-like putative selenoprotein